MQTWDNPACGSVRWQSLFSGEGTPTDSLTCGVAHVRAGDTFALHCHPQAEVYFCLSGHGIVQVAGQDFPLSPGTALFIPGGAVHGIPHAEGDMSWFYVFATDRFEQVAYSFEPAQGVALRLPATGPKPTPEQE